MMSLETVPRITCDIPGCGAVLRLYGTGDAYQRLEKLRAEGTEWHLGKVGDEHVYDCCPEHRGMVPPKPEPVEDDIQF